MSESSSNALTDDGDSGDKCHSLQKQSTKTGIKANFNYQKRQNFVYETLKIQKLERLLKVSYDALSENFEISIKTVKRPWKPVRAALLNGDTKVDVGVQRKGNYERKKRKEMKRNNTDTIKAIYFTYRRSLRAMQIALEKTGVGSLSTLRRIAKENKAF